MNLLLFTIELPNQILSNIHNYQLYVDPIVFRKPEASVPTNPNLLLPFHQQHLSPKPVLKK
ncbi:hypothetical protein Fmac_008332 [Flemingia macrophylla]|uniref:Uncharacterized protein n=1 Tax=Flemingia macrophylla TaxID=520843 RepID=A0ABD1MX32_9FABA